MILIRPGGKAPFANEAHGVGQPELEERSLALFDLEGAFEAHMWSRKVTLKLRGAIEVNISALTPRILLKKRQKGKVGPERQL